MSRVLEAAIPVIDPYGSVFRLLRGVELPFSLFRVEDATELDRELDVPFVILSSYGKPDAAAVALAERMPTVVYAVQVRECDPAPLMRVLGYVSDRMPVGDIRAVLLRALGIVMSR